VSIQYVCSVCRGGIVIFYVAKVLLITCDYRSAGLSYVGMFVRVTFKWIYSNVVGIIKFL
jgi:hypothetical protein